MEIFFVAVGVVVLVMWFNKAKTREVEQRAAAAFTYREPNGYNTWTANFSTSRLHYYWLPPDPDPSDPNNNAEYELRRDGPGAWSIRHTPESWARAVQNARAREVGKFANDDDRTEAREELDCLGDKPGWKPLFPDLVAMVESRYQDFAAAFGGR